MATAEIRVRYPCGFEFYMNVNVGLLGSFSIDEDDWKVCPMHGKSCSKTPYCPREIKKEKKR